MMMMMILQSKAPSSSVLLLFLTITIRMGDMVDGFASTIATSVDHQKQDSHHPLSDDLQQELQSQNPNHDAQPYDYFAVQGYDENLLLQPMINDDDPDLTLINDDLKFIHHPHYETYSLNDLFPYPGLHMSEVFNSCTEFRNSLRNAIRQDMILDDTIYGYMTNDETRYEELAKNQPLIGFWKHDHHDDDDTTNNSNSIRMKHMTTVLRQYLGPNAPTGDEFLEKIGSLTNSTQPPYHWTEVVGVAATQNAKMGQKTKHSWHQDYGQLETITNNNKHVFLGFPYEDNYKGTGVFSHLIKLKHEQLWMKSQKHISSGKSIFYKGTVPDQYIVKPEYVPGKNEILVFRDIDVLHSTPDIQYRTSIMRFG